MTATNGAPLLRVYTVTANGITHVTEQRASTYAGCTARCGAVVAPFEADDTRSLTPGDVSCAVCLRLAEEAGQQHATYIRRFQLGTGMIRGAGMTYGTSAACHCGWKAKVNIAPSRGGTKAMEAAVAQHLADEERS